MPKVIENPFADYGRIIRGKHFIGREDDIHAINGRVLNADPGCLAIVGEPRIGKSSLVYHAIMEREQELRKQRLLPIWINLALYEQTSVFFHSLVTECLTAIKEQENWLTADIQSAADACSQEYTSWVEGYGRIKRFFKKVLLADIHVLFILDEFDRARTLFKGKVSAIQSLRELGYHPDFHVTFITTSRRAISSIEMEANASSTLEGIFHSHYLGIFDEDDVQEYFTRLTSTGVPIDSLLKARIDSYTGRHPYLLAMLGYEMVKIFQEQGQADVDGAVHRREEAFVKYYNQLVRLLREDERFNKLLQILFGPVIDINQTDVGEFIKYGLIKHNLHSLSNQNSTMPGYIAFSEHFQWYLEQIGRRVDVWPLLGDTERTLRKHIASEFQKKYKEKWQTELSDSHKAIFQACLEMQKRDKWVDKSENLLDYTYIRDLFTIIFNKKNWYMFKPIFGTKQPKDELNYWQQRGDTISKVRNPLAHHRDEVVPPFERLQAEGFCHEILDTIDKYENTLRDVI